VVASSLNGVQRFVVGNPGVTTGSVIGLGILVALIPYVGPALAIAVIAAGLVSASLIRRQVRQELAVADPGYALSAGHSGPPDQPVGQITRVLQQPRQQPGPPPPNVESVAAQLPVDPRDRPLDEQIEIAGETHYTKQIRRVFRDQSTEIASKGATLRDLQCVLVPEPWSNYDPNAVAVVIGGRQVGHLPAELVADYAHPLQQIAQSGFLVAGRARVWAKDEGGMIRARVTVVVPAVEDL
jgi:hypothetical protein